jgi:hypothetical protein
MPANDAQVSAQAEIYKPNLDSEEALLNVVTDVCRWFTEHFGEFEVGNLEETVKATVEELVNSAIGETGLIRAVSLILSLKAFFLHCPAFNDYLRNKLVSVVDNALTIKEKEKTVFRVSPEVISKAVASVPSFEELREVVVKSIAFGIAKPLTITDLRELARDGRVSVVFDARKHRHQITIKLKNKFTDVDTEVILSLSTEKSNIVLKYGYKIDEEPKQGKKKGSEGVNPLFKKVPRVLEPYVALFLKLGWVPAFSSLEFVKFVLELENREQAVYNTTRDELRGLLLHTLKKFKVASVSYKDGARLYDPVFVSNLKEFVFIDETNKELIVPSRFFTELEVKSGYKSVLINLLAKERLLKTKHTTYTFARKDKPDDKTTLNVVVFSLDKLRELLGFDPRDLMKTEELDISKLIELSEGRERGDENDVDQ